MKYVFKLTKLKVKLIFFNYLAIKGKYFIQPVRIIEGTGSEVIDFLNRISTNELMSLKPGQTTGTIFLNEKGRIIGFVKIINNFEKIWIITGKGTENDIFRHLEKYIFNDDVKFTIRDEEFEERTVFYDDMNEYIEFRNKIINQFPFPRNFFYYPDNLYGNTFNIVISEKQKSILTDYLEDYESMSDTELEYYRISNKIPKYPNEINDKVNPLECGLEKYVSYDKGCYTGQEVISRIDSRNKIPRTLKLFKSGYKPVKNDFIYFTQNEKETESGYISSILEYKGEIFCLGFIRTIYFSDENEYYTKINNSEKNKLILIN